MSRYTVFDLETTNRSKGSALDPSNRIVMVAWKRHGEGVKDYYGPDLLTCYDFWAALEDADVLICQNAKFEMGWLLRLGWDIHGKRWYDTMLGEKVKFGNLRRPLNLDAMAKRYGYADKDPLVDSLMKAGVCPSEMDPRRLRARCRRDVVVTEQIAIAQLKLLRKTGRLEVARTRCTLTPVLAEIEATGMQLDAERVEAAHAEASTALGTLQVELREITGGINLKSPKQKAELFYDKLKLPEPTDWRGKPRRTGKGGRATDKRAVDWLATQAKTDDQRRFFELVGEEARLSARLQKNLDFFLGVVREQGGHFHGSFNQHIAATHRLTSTGRPTKFAMFPKPKSVQFQNMPRDMKRLFTGSLITEADGKQLEFRVAAFLGQDPQAMADILDPDFDAHCTSASEMFQIPYREFLEGYRAGDKAVAKLRTAAKAETFKPLFGGSKGTPEQERWYTAFRERYAELYKVQLEWYDQVLSSGGTLRMPWGMQFRWEYTLNPRGDAVDRTTFKPIKQAVFNYPIQSLATAEIIPIALFSLHRRCKERGLGVQFLNTVHDSVVAAVRPEVLEAYKEEVKHAFTHDVYEYLQSRYGLRFNVPLGVELKWGSHWGEGDSLEYDALPPAVDKRARQA